MQVFILKFPTYHIMWNKLTKSQARTHAHTRVHTYMYKYIHIQIYLRFTTFYRVTRTYITWMYSILFNYRGTIYLYIKLKVNFKNYCLHVHWRVLRKKWPKNRNNNNYLYYYYYYDRNIMIIIRFRLDALNINGINSNEHNNNNNYHY